MESAAGQLSRNLAHLKTNKKNKAALVRVEYLSKTIGLQF